MLTLCYKKSFQQKSEFRFKNYENAGFEVQATTHLAETTVLTDVRPLTIFSAIYVVTCKSVSHAQLQISKSALCNVHLRNYLCEEEKSKDADEKV